MDEKTRKTLEYHKIMTLLSDRCAFSASKALALDWQPTNDIRIARQWLAETTEARRLFTNAPSTSIGGARDIREDVDAADHGIVLDPRSLLDIKATLISARELKRTFERMDSAYPALTEMAERMPVPHGLVDAITRIITDRGEVHDNASKELSSIRKELRIVHDRLLERMQRMLSDKKIAPYLQDNLVTIRDGRYVLPLRADFKGRVKAVVHDQSSSGATLFIEPLSVVDQNNRYRQLQLDERDEVRRILAELSGMIGSHKDQLNWMVEGIAELDLVFARAKYAEDLDATEPRLLRLPQKTKKGGHPGSTVRLLGARHPLLDPHTVVPIDVTLDENTYAVIITGPNTGGKTVSLKTVGLLILMAQAGLHIPAESGSEFSCFESIFADIGDEQSIEQSLSTFSGHITNIIRILAQVDRRSLVIFDELGSGTDPQEGAALAMAIMSHLLDRSVTTFVATHYPELKTYALTQAGVTNASVEFDIETLRPTYHLIIGLPGASNALTIAQRLGLEDEIIQSARDGISTDELEASDLLSEIHQQREMIRRIRSETETTRSEIQKLREQLAARLDSIEDERRDILEKARIEGEDRISSIDAELRELRRKLANARQPLDVIEEVEEIVYEMEDEVSVPIERTDPVPRSQSTSDKHRDLPIRLGDKVRLKSLGTQGIVSALAEEEAEVQIGMMRVRARLVELERISGSTPAPPAAPKQMQANAQFLSSPGVELDLRGLRAEEAREKLDDYLDAAYLSQTPFVRIIHGKGTGKLRKVVQEALRANEHIKSFELGKDGEGGEGVTVAKFVAL